MLTPRMILPILGVASDETGQPDVVLSGAAEESALSEDGQSEGQRGSSLLILNSQLHSLLYHPLNVIVLFVVCFQRL